MIGFKEKIEVSISVVSDYYFSQRKPSIEYQVQKCVVCTERDVNTLIEPCGHALMCKECLIKHFAETKQCPQCRQGFKKALLIDFDPVQKKFYAQGEIVQEDKP